MSFKVKNKLQTISPMLWTNTLQSLQNYGIFVSRGYPLNLQSVLSCQRVSRLPAAGDVGPIQEHTANQMWGSQRGPGACVGQDWRKDWRWREAGVNSMKLLSKWEKTANVNK